MKHSRVLVLIGAISALIIMTALSSAFGAVVPMLIPKKWTILLSMLLFLFFALKLFWEVYKNEVSKMDKNMFFYKFSKFLN